MMVPNGVVLATAVVPLREPDQVDLRARFDTRVSPSEIQELNDGKKEVFAEAKGEGFDVKILKEIVKLRKQDQDERDEHETLLDVYMRAMQSTPAEPTAKAA